VNVLHIGIVCVFFLVVVCDDRDSSFDDAVLCVEFVTLRLLIGSDPLKNPEASIDDIAHVVLSNVGRVSNTLRC
jgi:hypothetical protein